MTIVEASKMASGNAMGTIVREKRPTSCSSKDVSRPFPTKSSMYFHRNCIMKMNVVRPKVIISGTMKLPKTTLSTRFNILNSCSENVLILQGAVKLLKPGLDALL